MGTANTFFTVSCSAARCDVGVLLLLSGKEYGVNTTPNLRGEGPFRLPLSRLKTALASNDNVFPDGNVTHPDCVRHALGFGLAWAVVPVLAYYGICPVFCGA